MSATRASRGRGQSGKGGRGARRAARRASARQRDEQRDREPARQLRRPRAGPAHGWRISKGASCRRVWLATASVTSSRTTYAPGA